MGRILCLDVGTVRVGVAISDPLGMTAQPLEVIHRKKTNPFLYIANLAQEREVQSILVGRPIQLDGSEGLAVKKIEAFVKNLHKHIDIPIEWVDERLSTAQAERVLLEGGVRREQRKQTIDKLAASVILQGYLDSRSR